MKVAIIGRTQILYETALKLHEEGHEIASIITAEAAPEYTRNESDFRELAKRLNASFLLTNTLNRSEIGKLCKDLDIGISINWLSLVSQKHINLFKLGILNSHHGNLPKYRGNACSNWAIINNEKQITNTIHFMEGDKLDCGRVVCQEHFKLNKDTTIADVYKWSEETTPLIYAKALRILDKDSSFFLYYANPDMPESFRCFPRLPEDGFINWEHSALKIHNLIRAVCSPFPGAYTYHRQQGRVSKLIVLKSRISQTRTKNVAIPGHVIKNDPETGESYVQCGEGIIALLQCKYDDEQNQFSPGNRWRSIRMRLGVRVEDWLWEIYKSLRN